MYKQNTKFSLMKDRKLGMRNSGRVNKTGFGGGGGGGSSSGGSGGYRGGINHGGISKNYGSRQFNLQDVTKLKQLCTATNEWIQQKSSELLHVLRRPENTGGDNSYRTVTLQSGTSKMNFGHKPPSMFDMNYKDNDFQQRRDSSEVPSLDYLPLNESHSANMNYEQNRKHCNQEERKWGFEPTNVPVKPTNVPVKPTNVPVKPTNVPVKPKGHLFSIIEKLKMYISDKPFSESNAVKLFVEAVNINGTSFTLHHSQVDKRKPHNFNLVIENLVLGVGKSFTKKKARLEAYVNALNQLKNSSLRELCGDVPSEKPESNRLSYQAIIEPDPTRPISVLVIRETHKTATRREKHAMSILRRSVYFSKMNMNKLTSMVGNVYKVTILVQNKPVGIGFGSSVTKASVNAAADALFNNFYRKNPVLQTLEEDDSSKWIHWTNIKYLAKEMERIGGHSLVGGQNISNRSFATAIKKLVDTHPWNEVNSDLIFGPGMSEYCVQTLYSIAKERNFNFEERQHRQFGQYYIIQRYFDPVDIVNYLEKNGGCKDKYRLVPKAEIPQIQCEHWEPKSQVWGQEKVHKEDFESKSLSPKRHEVSHFPRMGESNRNFDDNSSHIERGFNSGTFSSMSSNKQKRAIDDDQDFGQMSYKDKEFALPHSKAKYFLPNNDVRFNEKFTQGKEMHSFNDGEYRQVSRSDNEFRPMSDSCDRELKQLSWPDDRGFGQRSQTDDKGFGQRSQTDDRGFGQRSQTDDRGFGQRSQTDDRGFGQRSQTDDRGFRQRSQTDDRGFGQRSQTDDRGFGQRSQTDDRGFGQRSQTDDMEFGPRSQTDDMGFGQRSQTDDMGFGQRSQTDDMGFGQRSQTDDMGFGQRSQTDDMGFGQRSQTDDMGFGQRSQTDDMGFGQRSQTDDRGFGQMSQTDDRGFGHMSQTDDRGFGQMSQTDDRGFGQMSQNDDRGFGQMSQNDDNRFGQMHNSEGFGQSSWFDSREFGQMGQPDEVEFGQMRQSGDREFRHRSQPSNEESNQTTWHDNGEFEQTYWHHGKKSNLMSDSHDREFRETSRHNSREFRRMRSLEEHDFNQAHGHMERGMSDNFDREFSRDKNQTLGHEERRFDTMHDYTDQDFNQMSDNYEREYDLRFRCSDRDMEQVLDSYDKERFSQNPYDNKHDKLSGHSDVGFHHSSNYNKRYSKDFDYDKQVSDPDKHYNQMLLQNERDYKTSCDDNRHYGQVPNYNDRRLRFSDDQVPGMDRQNNQRTPDNVMDPKRMQSNVPWNNMQDTRGDGRSVMANSIRYPPNVQMPCGSVPGNIMMQSMMTMSQEPNKDQLSALRFLTKKIAHTALHAMTVTNVKSILANAQRLSNIAKARSQIEKSSSSKALLNAKKYGKGTEASKFHKRNVPVAQPKTAPHSAQNSKSSTQKQQPALNKPINRKISSQNKNAIKKKIPPAVPKGGNNSQKK